MKHKTKHLVIRKVFKPFKCKKNTVKNHLKETDRDKIQMLELKEKLDSKDKELRELKKKYDELLSEKKEDISSAEKSTMLETRLETSDSLRDSLNDRLKDKESFIQTLEEKIKYIESDQKDYEEDW